MISMPRSSKKGKEEDDIPIPPQQSSSLILQLEIVYPEAK